MKKIIILIAIFCCMVNARVLNYSKTINHVKCTVRINPEKGRVEVGKCNVLGIYFMDKDDMLVTAYDDTLIANNYYSNVDFFAYEEENYVKDVAKIIVKFEEPVSKKLGKEPREVIFQAYGSPYTDGRLPSNCWGNPKNEYWCSWRGGVPSL